MKTKKFILTVLAAMSIAISQAEEGNITIDMSDQKSFWKSLVSEQNLYFNSRYSSIIEDPSEYCFAFKVVAHDLEEGVVYLKHISVVPANTPIWIWGGHQEHSITTFTDFEELGQYDTAFDDVSDNLLLGSASSKTPVQMGDYVLSKKDDFVHAVTSAMVGEELPEGKCLLRLGSSSRATLKIGLLDDDDETQAIDALMTSDGKLIMYDATKPSFDAQGRRIAPQQKGLHIQNGYKFYIK